MHRRALLLTCPLLATLAGCGGGTRTETVTVTRAVTVTAPQTTTEAAAATAAAPAGLPDGQIALIGTFDMRVSDTNPPGINASGASTGTDEEWRLSTTCDDGCTVELRRRLPSGGLETVELEPKDDAPGQWFGEFRSTGSCGPRDVRTDATLTLRSLQDRDRVATKLEAYWRAEDIECVNEEGGTARYTGTLR